MTLAAVGCLAVGLGATIAIASAVQAALLAPPPFRAPDELVTVYRTTPHFNTGPHSAPNYRELAATVRQIRSLAALSPATKLLAVGGETVRVSALRVSGNLFETLGVAPLAGHFFAAGDDSLERPGTAVLSAELWRDRFGGDPAVVGRIVRLDGEAFTVVGVAPERFEVPHGPRLLRAQIWIPLRLSADQLADRGSNYLMAVGRLAPGATAASATEELGRLFAGIEAQHPELRGEGLRAVPLRQEATRAVRTPLLLLFAAVLIVLLIACGNVASLLLARGVRRQREIAVRVALGGDRWAIVRPVLAESLALAVAGLAAGLIVGWIGIRTIGVLAAQQLPQLAHVALDGRVTVFALGLCLLTALLCGAAPAWRALAVDPQTVLGSTRGGSTSRGHQRALSTLVVAEVALSLTLLIGAGLVLQGFRQLTSSDPGFDPERLTTFELSTLPRTAAQAGRDGSSVRRVLEPVLEALRALPGVESAAALSQVPYDNWGWNFNVRYEGQPDNEPTQRPLIENRIATPDLFAVTGQRLLAGRGLESSDDERPEAPSVVVVNEALARRDFPDGSAVGKRFYDGDDGKSLTTIVGVVSDIKNFGPFQAPRPEIYRAYRQSGDGTSFPIVVRWRAGAPRASLRQIVALVHAVDPRAAVERSRSLREVIDASLGAPRLYLSLLAVFAAVAVSLALAGLFGVMAYSVAQRTRELGIRTALGSSPSRTLGLVTGAGLRLVAVGLGVGLLSSFGVTRWLGALLYGVSPLDAGVWVAACLLFAAIGALATLAPSLRAAHSDPMGALRMD